MKFLSIPDRTSSPLGKQSPDPQFPPPECRMPPVQPPPLDRDRLHRNTSETSIRRTSSFWSLSSRRSSSTTRPKPRLSLLARSRHPSDLDVVWVQLLAHLSENNLPAVVSLLVRTRPSRRHTSQPALALVRVRTILAILSHVQEHRTERSRNPRPLSHSTARYLLAALDAGSYDAAAETLHMYYARRLNLPDKPAVEAAVALVERGADAGHAASQAVLGTLLCRTSAFGARLEGPKARVFEELPWSDVSSPESSSGDSDASSGKEEGAGRRGRKKKKKKSRRVRLLVRGKDTTRGSALLRKAAGQGCALALDQIQRAVIAEYDMARLGANAHVTEEEKGKLFSRVSSVLSVVSVEDMAGEQYAASVREAAEKKVPHCAVRMSKVLRKGIGEKRDEKAARKWVRLAAELNVPSAISAAHADAVRENLKTAMVLSWNLNGEGVDSLQTIEREVAAKERFRENKRLIKRYEKDMKHWRGESEELKEILLLHNVCNLRGAICQTLCEALLRFISERDRDGWGHYPTFFLRR